MSQVLSTLKPNDGIRVSKLAVASSLAALGYWTYLVVGPRIAAKKIHGTASCSSSSLSTDNNNKQVDLRRLMNVSKVPGAKNTHNKHRLSVKLTMRQLKIILSSIIGYKEVFLAAGMSVGLLFRTMLDLYQISNGTEIEKAIITGNSRDLFQTIASFSVYMPLFAFVNNFIKLNADQLTLRLRTKLSMKLYREYMRDLTFYKLSQQTTDAHSNQTKLQLKNVDQLLTADVEKFCLSIVELYTNLTKPMLDIIILVKRLSSTYTGIQTPAIMMIYLLFAGTLITQARKSLSGHILNETQCEGHLRYVHSRLIQNSEEISFYRGNKKELTNLQDALTELDGALSNLILFKFKIGVFDNVVGRYVSTIVGYLALALPFFSSMYQSESNESKLGYYYVAGRMMMKLAESMQRVMVASNDFTRLAAYTQRVQALLDSVSQNKQKINESDATNNKRLSIGFEEEDKEHENFSSSSWTECDAKAPFISLKNATITTPGGDILIRNVTFTIKQHQNVLICGPNGSGKSSIFRVLAGLWTVESGEVVRPPIDQLFYICQKPYMTLGTFRDQIIYPETYNDFCSIKKANDERLVEILKLVSLDYLLDREENFFDSVCDWQDVLSGGEKQRIALARLIYHEPQFAILDECTSQVSIDVEQEIYEYLHSKLNMTLLSVSHRVKQLQKFHQFVLKLDRDGSYQFKRLDPEDL